MDIPHVGPKTMNDMDCDVCMRPFNVRRRPFCPSCAQTTLYSSRITQVTSLLEREKSHSQAEAILRPGNDGVLAALPDDIDFDAITTGMKKYSLERYKAEQQIVGDRIAAITSNAEQLRRKIEDYKSYMTDRKDGMSRRRKVLAMEAKELDRMQPRMLEPVQTTAKKSSYKLGKVRDKIVDSRALLCREAALACGLQKRRGPKDRSEYVIGGIVIPDLRELGMRSRGQSGNATSSERVLAEPHALITASLEDVARLLSITAHYLSVRLPAEIVLPHGDSPRCAIMSERASYKQDEIHVPSHASSLTDSPAASKLMDPMLPRPRPLFLDYPLAHLSKEDPKSYGLFVEGVSLLAWDIAWLCRTQGINNVNTFEDFCKIGRNLWQLVVTQTHQPSRSALTRKASAAHERDQPGQNPDQARFGLFSHATAGHNLASAVGLDLLRDWKILSPARATDKLKAFLLTEIQGAEWDLLDEQEWDQEREDEMAVLVGGSRRPQDSRHSSMSVMTVAPPDLAEDMKTAGADEKKKGSNGWMKIRGRTEGV